MSKAMNSWIKRLKPHSFLLALGMLSILFVSSAHADCRPEGDPFVGPTVMPSGPRANHCLDPSKRSYRLITPEQARGVVGNFGHLKAGVEYQFIANVSHDHEHWIGAFPVDAVETIDFQIDEFPPLLIAAHTQLRVNFRPETPVILYHQTDRSRDPISLGEIILSHEIVSLLDGKGYDLKEGMQGAFANAARLASLWERADDMSVRQDQRVRQYRLSLTTEEANGLWKFMLPFFHDPEMTKLYDTVSRNCTTQLFEMFKAWQPARIGWFNELAQRGIILAPTYAKQGLELGHLLGKEKLPDLREELIERFAAREYDKADVASGCPLAKDPFAPSGIMPSWTSRVWEMQFWKSKKRCLNVGDGGSRGYKIITPAEFDAHFKKRSPHSFKSIPNHENIRLLANVSHEETYWVMAIERDAIREIFFEKQILEPNLGIAHTQMRFVFKDGKEATLFNQKDPKAEPVKLPGIIFSVEGARTVGGPQEFGFIAGMTGQFGLAHRLISEKDKIRASIINDKNEVQQMKIKLSETRLNDLFWSVIEVMHDPTMPKVYNYALKNCTNSLFYALDAYLKRDRGVLDRVYTSLPWFAFPALKERRIVNREGKLADDLNFTVLRKFFEKGCQRTLLIEDAPL
ncbi:MAG: DUF4105 domain-containing protein [Cryobacterium sp.]|nr:DUF4105 domain-containing protein [Oligoflexia bacterium]